MNFSGSTLYILCWGLYNVRKAVKYLSWHDEGETILMNQRIGLGNPPKFMPLDEVQLIGRVYLGLAEILKKIGT